MLTRPVGRTRLLVAKLVSVLAFVLLAVVVVAAVGYVVGPLLLGNGDSGGLVTGVSGSSLTSTQLVERTLLSIVYVVAVDARRGGDGADALDVHRLPARRRRSARWRS